MANSKSFTKPTKPHVCVLSVWFSPPYYVMNEIRVIIFHEKALFGAGWNETSNHLS